MTPNPFVKPARICPPISVPIPACHQFIVVPLCRVASWEPCSTCARAGAGIERAQRCTRSARVSPRTESEAPEFFVSPPCRFTSPASCCVRCHGEPHGTRNEDFPQKQKLRCLQRIRFRTLRKRRLTWTGKKDPERTAVAKKKQSAVHF